MYLSLGFFFLLRDCFVIDPIFFGEGNIGKVAVCGTVNDLAVSGAKPLYLSLALVLEEGFPIKDLEEILDSIRETAKEAGVYIVNSADGPAPERPSISDVSVVPMVSMNTESFDPCSFSSKSVDP